MYPGARQAQEAIEDQKIGSPEWFESMVNGYLKIRDKYAKPYWDAAYELFSGEMFQGFAMSPTAYGLTEVQPARVFGLVQSIESQVVANRPEFICDPIKARTEDLAAWGQTVINADWQRTRHMMSELRMATRNCILTGWGPMLSGVETDYEAARRDRKRRHRVADQIQSDPILGEIQAELAGELAQGPDSVDEPKLEAGFEMTDLVWQKRVYSRAIDPFQFLIDPNASSLADAEWCGRLIIARLDAVKKNKRFSNTRGLKSSGVFSGSPEARSSMSPENGKWNRIHGRLFAGDDIGRIVLYELFVRQDEGTWDRITFAKGHKKPLEYIEDCYDIGCPYKLLRWNQTSKSIFAVSDVQSVMTEVIEEREIRTRCHDGFVRAPIDTYILDRTIFNQDTEITPLQMEGIGNILLANLMGRPASSAAQLLQRNSQMQEVLAYLQIIKQSVQEVTGLGANQQSQALKSETSATEAAEIAKWAGSRGRSKFAFAEDFASDVALDRLGLICQFYDEYDIGAIAGPEAAKFWVGEKFTAGDIRAGLSVRVEQGTMQPRDNASASAKLQQLLMLCLNPQTAQLANIYINAGATIEEMLRHEGIPKGSKILNPVGPDLTMKLGMILQSMAQQGGGEGGGGQAPGAPATPSGAAEAAQTEGRS